MIAAWFLFAAAGIVTIYCGYRLRSEYDRTVVGSLYAIAGVLIVAIWVGYLLSIL